MKWNKFPTITSKKELDEYFMNREYTHTKYSHYTKLETVIKIINGKQLLIGPVSGFNDKCDSKQFGDDKKEQSPYFSICFSTGVNENLPLWYLYSGMDGHGARITLTKSAFSDLIERGTYTLCKEETNADNKTEFKDIMALSIGEPKTMERIVKDVVYFKENSESEKCDLKYNTMTNHEMPLKAWEDYRAANKGSAKGLLWYYEKETRVLVKLQGKAAELVEEDTEGKYRVALRFDEKLCRRIKVELAPEITSVSEITTEDKAVLDDFIMKTSNVHLSDYKGTVEMKLCEKCPLKKAEIEKK